MNDIKITVITVTYNCKKYIEKTLESISTQTYKNIELIIVDGKSNDGTWEIINNYKSKITKKISEKDSGIYDAMNKGIALSSGEYIFFLNAGDIFVNDTVVENVCKKITSEDVVYGNVILVEKNNKKIVKKFPKSLDFKFMVLDTICHQAVFMKKELLNKYKFNQNEKIFADYELWIKIFLNKNIWNIKKIDINIAEYNLEGISSKLKKIDTMKARGKIFRKYVKGKNGWLYYPIWFVFKIPYYIDSKFIRGNK